MLLTPTPVLMKNDAATENALETKDRIGTQNLPSAWFSKEKSQVYAQKTTEMGALIYLNQKQPKLGYYLYL